MLSEKKLPVLFAGLLLATPFMANANIAQKYEESCATCHATGALNAPRTGDTALWKKLKSQKGMPALVSSVKNGMPQMPAGGLCSDCSDADFRDLIEYMSK